MPGILDDVSVGGLILISAVYATYSLGPKALRRRLTLGTALLLRKLPAVLHLRGAAQRVEAASQKAGGSCGGCENCGSGAIPSTDVRIPVSSIRRR